MGKKAAVVFHSACGNTMLMAKEYVRALKKEGISADLFRVEDPLLDQTVQAFPLAREMMKEIKAVPIVGHKRLPEYDAIFLGSPTYYGNVSAQVKAFLDSLCDFWLPASLAGIYFGAFATASTPCGGGDLSMIAMHMSAMHMGMVSISVPTTVAHAGMPAYGILHCTGEQSNIRPGNDVFRAIDEYVAYCGKVIG